MQEAPDLTHTMPSRLNFAHGQEGDLLMARPVADADGICGYLFFDLMDEQIYEAVRECPLDDVVITDRYDNLVLQWEGRMRTPWKNILPANTGWTGRRAIL